MNIGKERHNQKYNRMQNRIEKWKQRFARRVLKREKGSVVIEAAFVYPIMFFVLLFLLYMGNMFYLKARIDSTVAGEAMRCAANYADPNMEQYSQAIPTTTAGKTVTEELYRYVNILDVGGYGTADTTDENNLRAKISEGGFYDRMVPYEVTINSHKVNNYVIYQTYEVEVSYKIKFPIRFIFDDDIVFLEMTSRSEVPVTDTAEFIRAVDMAVDYMQQTKTGEEFTKKVKRS